MELNVSVIGVVTDNCATMNSMRSAFIRERPALFAYSCHAHLLNLVGEKLTPNNLTESIVKVQKYFRNHHYPAAALKQMQGRRPVIPGKTRWNSQMDCYDSFLQNRHVYAAIAESDPDPVDEEISAILDNSISVLEAKAVLRLLKPVAVALDRVRRVRLLLIELEFTTLLFSGATCKL